jgi:hypothetical protein
VGESETRGRCLIAIAFMDAGEPDGHAESPGEDRVIRASAELNSQDADGAIEDLVADKAGGVESFMPMRRHFLWIPVVVGLASLGPLSAQTPQATPPARTQIDVSKLGPQVGEQVPDFSLPDQNGRTQTLQSILGPRGAMLVFVRSADW